jgi:putative endonuclease
MWYVYMLKNARGHFYTGVTTDLTRRVQEHNGEKKGGAKYTQAHRPYVLVYQETCASRSEAQVRESALKRLSHTDKGLLCNVYTEKVHSEVE